MKKFKEILFLKCLKRVGKKTIYKKYWTDLNNAIDFDELVLKIKLKQEFANEDINEAIINASKIYDDVLNNTHINVITIFDENYPKKLMIMENNRPLILYIKGNIDALLKPNIAIIGTRKPCDLSKTFEKELVENIVNSTDRVIVSGLALGCDKIAHQTTVNKNKITIAVLPSGVNIIKPSKNHKLAEKIIETGGCLISEYEPNTPVYKGNYIERDKIVAALTDATFVIECGIKSGTMHTVNAAEDYKKQIFAYLPEDLSKGKYEGNEFILKNNSGAIKVSDIDKFQEKLITFNSKKVSKSIQSTF